VKAYRLCNTPFLLNESYPHCFKNLKETLRMKLQLNLLSKTMIASTAVSSALLCSFPASATTTTKAVQLPPAAAAPAIKPEGTPGGGGSGTQKSAGGMPGGGGGGTLQPTKPMPGGGGSGTLQPSQASAPAARK
jgi:hypothetical protein